MTAHIRTYRRAFQSPDLPPVFVKIRRGYLLEDGLAMLDKLRGTSLRRRVIIVLISQTGAQEAGVDSGGLLREFVSELCNRAFSPDFGLFTRTPDDGLLYPNPAAGLAHQGGDHLRLFELLGCMLGKAVFEGIVIDALFAPFFLGALRGRQQFFHVLDDLRQLDAEVHKNLTFLRSCHEDVEALGLTFTVARNDFGESEEVELVPRGRDLAVTHANRFSYIQLVAKHYIVDRIAPHTQAFVRGFHAVVPASALQAFSEPELQILVSGSLAGIDVADMRRHAQYAGGYTGLDRHVRRLWEALGSLSQEELSLFLQFVASSRRAPTGGFGTLNPPLTIVRVPIRRDDERLPVGRTCFNQLLWPVRRDFRDWVVVWKEGEALTYEFICHFPPQNKHTDVQEHAGGAREAALRHLSPGGLRADIARQSVDRVSRMIHVRQKKNEMKKLQQQWSRDGPAAMAVVARFRSDFVIFLFFQRVPFHSISHIYVRRRLANHPLRHERLERRELVRHSGRLQQTRASDHRRRPKAQGLRRRRPALSPSPLRWPRRRTLDQPGQRAMQRPPPLLLH